MVWELLSMKLHGGAVAGTHQAVDAVNNAGIRAFRGEFRETGDREEELLVDGPLERALALVVPDEEQLREVAGSAVKAFEGRCPLLHMSRTGARR